MPALNPRYLETAIKKQPLAGFYQRSEVENRDQGREPELSGATIFSRRNRDDTVVPMTSENSNAFYYAQD